MLGSMLPKMDVFHIVQVLTGEADATPAEHRNIQKFLHLLKQPAIGDLVWQQVAQFAEKSSFKDIILALLQQAATKSGLEPPATIAASAALMIHLMEKVEEKGAPLAIQAVIRCPFCQEMFTEINHG